MKYTVPFILRTQTVRNSDYLNEQPSLVSLYLVADEMVRVVNNSHYGYGYLENNLQLARKVSELEQQLGAAIQEIQQLRTASHRKDVRIVELEGLVNALQTYRAKHEAIKNIILGTGPVESIRPSIIHQTTSIRALTNSHCETRNPTLRLPSISHNESTDSCDGDPEGELSRPLGSPSSDNSNSTITANESNNEEDDGPEESATVAEDNESLSEHDESGRLTANVLEPIIEDSEEEHHHGDVKSVRNGTTRSSLPSPSSTRTISPIEDSLEPADVTSVPPIHQIERTMHTPSIWNCLDSLESDSNSQQKQKEHQQSQQKLIQSPARSVASSPSGGLRISQNINSSSPIHPVVHKAGPNFNEDMFHSTPVQAPGSKGFSSLLNKKSISDPKLSSINQENVEKQTQIDRTEVTNDAKKKQPVRKARTAAATKSKRSVRRAVKFTPEEDQSIKEALTPASVLTDGLVHEAPTLPTRYNLRKRARV